MAIKHLFLSEYFEQEMQRTEFTYVDSTIDFV
jgi:hypothetical protein